MSYHEICNHIDTAYGCKIAGELSRIGNDNSASGFRNAGSTGERKAAKYIAKEMRKIGLHNVSNNSFEVDCWEFRDSKLVYYKCGKRILYPLSAFAGVDGTGDSGIRARIVDAGYGRYQDCEKTDVNGAIALIRVDLSKEYWLGAPAYQLELKGALAVIVVMEGSQFGNCEEALNSGDCISRPNIPIVNISRENGKKLIEDLKTGGVVGRLSVDCTLSKGISQNITGEIPGKKEDEFILLGGHYDGYFRAYIDDAFATGAALAMAKAFIDSGYRPQYTVKVIAHGAEEFGACDSHCDWCIGSWRQITDLSPKWATQVRLFLNIDAVNPDAKDFRIQAAPQLHGFMNACMREISTDINKVWEKGYIIEDVNGPWSDDFSYYIAGVPVAICGRGESEWRKKYYHTNLDNCENLREALLENICLVYMKMLYDFDRRDVLPIDISAELKGFQDSIREALFFGEKIEIRDLKNAVSELEQLLVHIPYPKTALITTLSNLLIRNIRALNFHDELVYKLSEPQKNINILNKVSEYVNGKNYRAAMEEMKYFCGIEIIKDFESSVYEYWCIKSLDEDKANLQWATGLMEKPIDVRKLYKMLSERDNARNISREIQTLKEGEKAKAKKQIQKITEAISDMVKEINST